MASRFSIGGDKAYRSHPATDGPMAEEATADGDSRADTSYSSVSLQNSYLLLAFDAVIMSSEDHFRITRTGLYAAMRKPLTIRDGARR